MNGYHEQFKGIIEREWGKLIDDQLAVVPGERDYLGGKFQTRYGVSRERTQKRLAEDRRSKIVYTSTHSLPPKVRDEQPADVESRR